MSRRFPEVLAVALLASPSLSCPDGARPAPPATGGETVRVVRIVDGDTIVVHRAGRDERVRYIGIDTPETVRPDHPVEPFGHEAHEANEELVRGRAVRLVFDRDLRDRHGRLLAYVHRDDDDLFVNADLVRRGLARVIEIRPNTARAAELRAIEAEARAARRGLWASAAP